MENRRVLFPAKFLVIASLLLSASSGFAGEDKIKSPKTRLPSLTGNSTFAGDSFREDLTIIQFWASWCTGCAAVMSQINELLPNHPDVGYVSISLDETKDVALKYFVNKSETTRKAVKNSFLDASGETFSQLNGVETLPYLLIVDKHGLILKRILGHPTKDDLELITKKNSVAAPVTPVAPVPPVTAGAKK